MALRPTIRTPFTTLRLDFGGGRLDLTSDATIRDDLSFRTLRNARLDRFTLRRRDGMKRVAVLTDATASNGAWTFGATTKYASIAHDASRLIPAGGFALKFSFTAKRPSGGNTAYYFDSRVAGKAYGPYTITLSDAGVVTCEWRKESDESAVSIAATAVDDEAVVHGLFVFDPVAGTTTLYINGEEDGTQVTSIGSTEKPMQDSCTWYFGVRSDGAGGIAANTNFNGRCDSFVLYSLRGLDPTASRPGGSRSWLDHARETTFQEEACPMQGSAIACYDFNESSGTTLVDHSRFGNDGTLTGSPTSSARVAYPAQTGNFVGVFQGADGKRTNVVARGGDLFSEVVRPGSS